MQHRGRMRSSGYNLKQGSFKLEVRRAVFAMRTLGQQSRLSREVELSLEAFKTHLDTALSNVVWSESCPHFEQEGGLENSCSFPPELPFDHTNTTWILRKKIRHKYYIFQGILAFTSSWKAFVRLYLAISFGCYNSLLRWSIHGKPLFSLRILTTLINHERIILLSLM